MTYSSNDTLPAGSNSPGQDRFQMIVIAILGFLSTVILLISLYNLGTFGAGWQAWAKGLVYGSSAWLVAYGINWLALGRGVPLVLKKRKGAVFVSGISILAVGLMFLTATFPGLVISDIEERRLQDHNFVVGQYVDDRIIVAEKSKALVPIMQSMAEDLAGQRDTEGDTGVGPVFRMLQDLFGRASGLSEQMTVSLGVSEVALGNIAAIQQQMDLTLSDESTNVWDRRDAYRRLYGALLTELSALDRATPVSLVRSYVSELDSGIQIPNREDATARINQRLAGYSATLVKALEEQQGVPSVPPQLPSKTGSLDTFAYIGKHLPIFGLTTLVDVIFPLLVWFYAVVTLGTFVPKTPKAPRKPDTAETVASLPAVDMTTFGQELRGVSAGDSREMVKNRPHGVLESGKT